jgi:hypothetical protein
MSIETLAAHLSTSVAGADDSVGDQLEVVRLVERVYFRIDSSIVLLAQRLNAVAGIRINKYLPVEYRLVRRRGASSVLRVHRRCVQLNGHFEKTLPIAN